MGTLSLDYKAGVNSGRVLTSTLWDQSGEIYVSIDGRQTNLPGYTYNQFCPNIGVNRTVTGCSNTAAAQILYYWTVDQGYSFDFNVSNSFYVIRNSDTGEERTSQSKYLADKESIIGVIGDYYFLGDPSSIADAWVVCDSPTNGEVSLSLANSSLASTSKAADGNFIAALMYYCGVKHRSQYGTALTSTLYPINTDYSGSESWNMNYTGPYKSIGFDSYYYIDRQVSQWSQIYLGKSGFTDLGLSVIRENIDYGEAVLLNITLTDVGNHTIYIDGYKKTDDGYKYHLNFGWGTHSNQTKWYSESDLQDEGTLFKVESVIYDLTPSVRVNVTDAGNGYAGGTFLRGIERINHIQNDKATTFTFSRSIAGKYISLNVASTITSDVDVTFENVNAVVSTAAAELISSARGLAFEMNDGALIVNSSTAEASARYVVRETGNSKVSLTLDNSYIYSGLGTYDVTKLNRMLNQSGYSYGETADYDAVYDSEDGYAVKAGRAADTVTLTNGSGIFGLIDLGDGSNVLTIDNGSLYYGQFTGYSDTLSVNMSLTNRQYTGSMVVLKDSESVNEFASASSNVLNVTFGADAIQEQTYNLITFFSDVDLLKSFTVNLTGPGGISAVLNEKNRQYGNFKLVYTEDSLGIAYEAGVTGNKVNFYHDNLLVQSFDSINNISVESGIRVEVLAGGSVSNITLAQGSSMSVSADSSVNNLTVSGALSLESGAAVNTITVNAGGTVSAAAGSAISNLTVDGSVTASGAVNLKTVTVNSGGTVSVAAGSAISNLTVAGSVTASGAANLSNITVDSGGSLSVASGSVVRGNLNIKKGGKVSFARGSNYIFDLSGSKPGTYMTQLTNLSLVSGSPTYTVNADANQTAGAYTLATGAAGFNSALEIQTGGVVLGSITVNSSFQSRGHNYSLKLKNSGELIFEVGSAVPATITIEQSGSVGENGVYKNVFQLKPDYAGKYVFSGNFGVLNGRVTIYNGSKALGKGKITNGQMSLFNNGKTILLDSAVQYTVVVENTDKGKTASDFTYKLQGVSIYWKGSHDDDTPDAKPAITVSAPLTPLASGWVGFSDLVDYQKFELVKAVNFGLSISGNRNLKVSILDSRLKSVLSATLSADGLMNTISSSKKLLADGTYYLKVEATKQTGEDGADYSVMVSGDSCFFTKGDNSDDQRSPNLPLRLITGPMNVVPDGWVGYGDPVDNYRVLLSDAARISFTIRASDLVKFQVVSAVSGKILQTTSVNGNQLLQDVNTKGLLLTAGEYYLTVTSTNASKGGSSDYSIAVNSSSVFFNKGDNSDDVRSKNLPLTLVTGPMNVVSDGWVGYGDTVDNYRIKLPDAARISFTVGATGPVKFQVINASSGKVMQSTTIKGTGVMEYVETKGLPLTGGEYYLAVTSMNASKGGSSDYSIAVNSSSVFFNEGDTSDDVRSPKLPVTSVSGPMTVVSKGWVGYGDAVDNYRISLVWDAQLSFTVKANGSANFQIVNAADGRVLQSTAIKGTPGSMTTVETSSLMLSAGEYYLTMISLDASKGGCADYSIAVNNRSQFYPKGDNSDDTISQASMKPAVLAGDDVTGWVGSGDAVDYIKLQTSENGCLNLDLDGTTSQALNNGQLMIGLFNGDGSAVGIVALDSDTLRSDSINSGIYYLGVSCADPSKYSTVYKIATNLIAG